MPRSPHGSEPYSIQVFLCLPGVRYHCSKEHGVLRTHFIDGETEAHPTQKVADHATLNVFSPCIAFCDRS